MFPFLTSKYTTNLSINAKALSLLMVQVSWEKKPARSLIYRHRDMQGS